MTRGIIGLLLLGNLIAAVIALKPFGGSAEDLQRQQRELSRQMRERLQSRIDLGALRLAHAFQRRPRHIRWVVEHLLRWTYSLWYAYFGSCDAAGERLCGTAIEEISYAGPIWSPYHIGPPR